MNKLETTLQEKKKLYDEFKNISQEYPDNENYKIIVVRLDYEIADISEQLYKKESK